MGIGRSFRLLFVPQCSDCGAEATDTAGRRIEADDTLLPPGVRQQLAADGWQVTAGNPRAHRGPWDPIGGDRLVCGTCTARTAAATAHWQAKTDADLARPRVKTLDLAARLGDGVTLSQRDGDAPRHRWLVERGGEVRGYVNRYKRKTSNSYSTGWEAWYRRGEQGFFRREAISGCQHSPGSNFLWSSRDLAAWGVLDNPPYEAGRPDWATRKKKADA